MVELLGAKVVAINGMPPEQMLTYFEPYFGGAKTSLRELSPLYYMSPEILHAIGQSESADSLTIKFLKNDNTEETKTIAASKFEKTAPKHWVSDWLNPSFFIDTTSWKSEVASTELALPFQHLDQNVHHQWIENTLYVQMNDSWNTEERNVNNYLKEVLKSIENKEIDKVIYDLRFNPGGDYHLGRPFIKKVKEILPADGKCYIVTGNGTFSAGIIAAAFAKHELDEQAVIVGEDVGDNLIFWADGGASMKLPNSNIRVNIWTAYNDWENGCKDFNKCFWIAIFDGFGVGDLNVNQNIKLSYEDYIKGKDSILEWILTR